VRLHVEDSKLDGEPSGLPYLEALDDYPGIADEALQCPDGTPAKQQRRLPLQQHHLDSLEAEPEWNHLAKLAASLS